MYKTIKDKIQRDQDYPLRQYEINVLTRVIDGTFYDVLEFDFHQERTDGIGEYIPLRQRRPSVRYPLCKIVVDDSVSLLFSEGHFPAIVCKDNATRDALTSIVKEAKLNEVMIEAATTGSVGSVAILLRVLGKRVFFKVFNTQFLTPTWQAEAPDTLEKVTEQYKAKGSVLKASGYAVDAADLELFFWFRREWTDQEEVWYQPAKIVAGHEVTFSKDATRTVKHELGFVPMVWIKNLPGGDDIDGRATFLPETIDTQVEIDYQLSQGGRALKYAGDPTLMIKEPAIDNDGTLTKGAGNALVVSDKGDAKLLEISGTATDAVISYVKALREMALEGAHGNRSNADKLSAAQSGRAMELMMQSLIWLADKLRISYGEGALLDLLRMVVKARKQFPLMLKDGTEVPELSVTDAISLRWPKWFAPTQADQQSQAETLTTLREGGLISRETAVGTIAPGYDIDDPKDEITRIEKDPPPPSATAKKNDPKPPLDAED
jgi:hypothetical protein